MMLTFCRYFFLLPALFRAVYGSQQFFNGFKGKYDAKYGYFSESQRLYYKEEARKMFYFGYDNYMKYAFPQDELNPVFCSGRGPDHENPSNININDVLGDYALTLVDCLDTLAVMGNASEFKRAVQLVIEQVSFDKPSTVQVFEATIRIIGSLLSAHLIIKDKKQPFGEVAPPGYDDQLLRQAHELASRLMPAFENTATGIPYPRVHLQEGVPRDCINETCIAGAGTLLLEFGILSHLLNDPVYQSVARRAINAMWSYRSNVTGLLGNIINIQTGAWEGRMSGLGAGLDSFYEYLLKSYILFGDMESLKKFNESYEIIKYYMRKGRKHCNSGDGFPPLYVNVNMKDGETANNWIDSLQASWAAVQVLYGDIDEAICSHAIYHAIWRRYGALPERYNYQLKAPDVSFYPLRPELVESTYVLYQATKNPFYLHVGKDILESLNKHAKAKCGYATIHDVTKKDHEDRMESFFLSETCKYLYLLFDVDNHVNKESSNYIFTTEGHLIPVQYQGFQKHRSSNFKSTRRKDSGIVEVDAQHSNITKNCNNIGDGVKYFLPLKSRYFEQMDSMIGLG